MDMDSHDEQATNDNNTAVWHSSSKLQANPFSDIDLAQKLQIYPDLNSVYPDGLSLVKLLNPYP